MFFAIGRGGEWELRGEGRRFEARVKKRGFGGSWLMVRLRVENASGGKGREKGVW